MATKLKGPVGKTGRKENPVKNDPDDILTVRRMLRANGFNVSDTGGMDGGLLKAIGNAQMKNGMKTPDQIVDPDGRVFKALLPKFEAAEKEAAKLKMIKVKYKGKEQMLLPEDFEKMKAEVFKNLAGYIDSLVSSHKVNLDIYEDYLDTAMLRDGYVKAVIQAVVIKVGSVKMPKSSLAGASIKAVGNLQRAVMKKNLAELETALPEAEAAVNAFSADVRRFLDDFVGSAGATVTVLQVGSGVSFAIVGALAAPVIVTGLGVSAATAAVMSGAGVAVLSSGATELGRHASGQNVTFFESIKNVAIDGTIGAATAGIGSKIPLGFVEKMAERVAPAIASKIPGLSAQMITPFIKKWLTGTGEEVIKTAIGEAVGMLGKMLKSGKTPTEKDFDEAVQKILMTAMTAGFLKNLASFQKKWAYDSRNAVEKTLIPSVLKDFLKGKKVPPVVMAKLQAEVWNKVSEEVMKGGITIALETSKGTDDPDKLSKAAEAGIVKDARTLKLIDKEVEKFLKKEKMI